VDPSQNADALVIKGTDLDELPGDPNDLQEDLQALASPWAGPNGGEIYVDGFSSGRLPPKESIREIRINQNPFSSSAIRWASVDARYLQNRAGITCNSSTTPRSRRPADTGTGAHAFQV
jgi:hypothetical protein